MNEEKKVNQRKPIVNGAIWSVKEISRAVPNTLIVSYLSFYATDVLGMKAALIATVLLLTKLMDGVTDILAGVIIDNTHTRWGKGRPYDWCILLTGISTILLFNAPKHGTVLQVIYLAIMYILNTAVFTTLLETGDAVFLLRAFPEEKERNSVFSFSLIIGQFIAITISVLLPMLIAGAGTNHAEWLKVVAMVTIPTSLLGMLRFFLIKETGVEEAAAREQGPVEKKEPEEKISLKDALSSIVQNPYILILSLGIFIIVISSGLLNTSMPYFFQYYIGDLSGMGTIMIGTYAILIMLIAFLPLSEIFGKANLLKAGVCLLAAGMIVRWMAGTNILMMTIGMAMVMVGVAPITMYFPLYIFDLMDYGEWKTGKRVEGMYAVFPQFANKVASSIAISLCGFILGAFGYDGNAAVQTESAMWAIQLTFNILPAVLSIAMAVVIVLFYNVDKKMPTVRKELAERHAAEAQAAQETAAEA